MREKVLQKIFPAFATVNSITLYGMAGSKNCVYIVA